MREFIAPVASLILHVAAPIVFLFVAWWLLVDGATR